MCGLKTSGSCEGPDTAGGIADNRVREPGISIPMAGDGKRVKLLRGVEDPNPGAACRLPFLGEYPW